MVEIDCDKPMKLETSPKVTKSKRSLHWCRSISKKISVQVLLQYQSKSYYIIGQEVYYIIGRFITLSGSYYIIGRFLLHYRAFITVSGVYYIIGWYTSHMVSSATANDQLVGKKRNASRTPSRRTAQAATLMSPTGKSVPRIDPCGTV